MLTGVLTGIAGAYISTAQNAGFIRDMTAGQGYIALAALIFGKWKPYSAFGACFLFGFLDALAIVANSLSKRVFKIWKGVRKVFYFFCYFFEPSFIVNIF